MTFLVGFVGFLFVLSQTSMGPAVVSGVLVAVLFNQTAGKWIDEARERRQEEFRERVRRIIKPHLPALLRRKRQLDRVDEYGVRNNTKWLKEINRFCDSVVYPALGSKPPEVPRGMKTQPRLSELDRFTAEVVAAAAERQAPEFARRFEPSMSPIDYEHFCADRLKLSGWSPTVTQASGDQGADIVATRSGRTIVVQCKHYAKPVGNKAVQEVTAALRHYNADASVIIATNGYTRSAEQLASSNGVTLLHHDDLTADLRLAHERA